MHLKFLTDDCLERIDAASRKILATTGVEIPHEETVARLLKAGAKQDAATGRVRIPPACVDRCLREAGKTFTIYGRNGDKRARFGVGQRNYNSIAGEAHWIDEKTNERRPPTMADVATAARLGDALENINIVGAMADPQDTPVGYRCVEVAATLVKNTTKPITFWFHDRRSAKFVTELFEAVSGGTAEAQERPIAYPFLEPISPLRFPFNGIDLLYETARLNLPVPIGPMAQVGLSAPGTLAGTLAVENAEILAGICITQVIRPGMPLCYGGIPHAFDMATMQMIFSGPEQCLMGAAMAQMGKRYGLPVYVNLGLTDSKTMDAQAGLEAGMSLLVGVLAGADIYGHMGICGVDQATSLDMLVMQDEIIGYVERVARGFEVSDETLAVEIVEQVGPGGTFIDSEHTAKHFRRELWFPRLLDRNFYDAWAEMGKPDMAKRCRERRDELLASHRPEPVSDELSAELDRIVAAARKHCRD